MGVGSLKKYLHDVFSLNKNILFVLLLSIFYFSMVSVCVIAADTTPPAILSSEPSGTIITNTFNLTLETDEDSNQALLPLLDLGILNANKVVSKTMANKSIPIPK